MSMFPKTEKELFMDSNILIQKKSIIKNYLSSEGDNKKENNKPFKLWSNKFVNSEFKKRKFRMSGCPLMTFAKLNGFVKSRL